MNRCARSGNSSSSTDTALPAATASINGLVDTDRNTWPGTASFFAAGFLHMPFILGVLGFAIAWYMYIKRPDLPEKLVAHTRVVYDVLVRKYGFDELYQFLFAGGARELGGALWRFGDEVLIDGLIVNGSAKAVGWFAGIARRIQSGFLYDYAFAMIIGLLVLMSLGLYLYGGW